MKPMNFPRRKKLRQAEALARLEARGMRTNHQQLVKLEEGGFAAVKESRRLSGLPKGDEKFIAELKARGFRVIK